MWARIPLKMQCVIIHISIPFLPYQEQEGVNSQGEFQRIPDTYLLQNFLSHSFPMQVNPVYFPQNHRQKNKRPTDTSN